MHIEFLVAKTGEKLSPQNKIVAASLSYSTSDWRSSADASDAGTFLLTCHSLSPTCFSLCIHCSVTTQTFALGVTVSFVYTAKSEIIGYVPPPPPVLFKVNLPRPLQNLCKK